MAAAAQIPAEIWLQIIQHASYVPQCDMSSHDPLPPNGSYHILSGKLIALIREALSTKYAISLVCKSWSNIVVEFLYEFIIVRKAVHIPLLIDQLSRAGAHISAKVQRIDFMCYATTQDVYYNGIFYNAKRLALAAAKLIRLCPSLRALSSPASLWERNVGMECYSKLFRLALMTVKDSLECLEWRSPWGIHPGLALSSLILPRLQIFILSLEPSFPYATSVEVGHWDDNVRDDFEDGYDYYSPEYPGDELSHLYWLCSSLHTVDAEYCWNWTPSSDRVSKCLSSLKHLVITSTPNWFPLQTKWSTLSNIDTITFQKETFRFVGGGGCYLPPTVHTIIFHARYLPITPPDFSHIKRVGLMGIEVLRPEEYDYVFNLFAGENGSGDDQFPSLKMIRFVDASSAGVKRKRELQFKLWERRCRSKGVRLEDELGQVISPDHL